VTPVDLYLHETIDPVRAPGAHTRYLDELGRIVQAQGNADGSAGGRCIANWVPVFLTGQWPQIIGFWQMPGGWDGFARHFDSHQELFHQPLDRWYGERSGGFDRVLVGAEYTPTLDEIAAQAHSAPVVLHQTVRLRPGGAAGYLADLGELKQAIGHRLGFYLFGGYEVALRNGTEVIVLWSFPDVRTFARTQAAPDDFPELAKWQQRAGAQEQSHTGVLVRPTQWSVLR
jgi:hypothetical protein